MDKKAYTIGFSTALSGVEKKHGEANVEAVKMAFDEAKKENLDFGLELVIKDDGAETNKAIEVAKKFSANDAIVGVIGPNGSDAAKAAAPIYHASNLPHITFTASLVEVSEKGYKTFFRLTPNDDVHAEIFIKFLEKYLNPKALLLINDDTKFAIGLNKYMAKYAKITGIDVIDILEIQENMDLEAIVEHVRELNPSYIFFSGMEPVCHSMAVKLREKGLKSIYLGTDAIKPSKFLTTPGYDVEGPYQSNVCVDLYRNKLASQFADQYKKRFGEIYSVYTAEAYVSAKLMIQAMKECDPEITRENVLNKIKSTKIDSMVGKISFQENGELEESKIGFYKFINQDKLEFIGFSSDIL